MKQTKLHFGKACLDLSQRRLLLDGKQARLGGRAFDVLLALAERHQRPVSKKELFEIVWPGLVVEENNLQVHISGLRKLLGPDAIVTIPGRGYQLSAPTPPEGTDDELDPRPATSGTVASPVAPRLYGRADDIAAVRELLRQQRLVSIVGASGIGKTHLARAIADAVAGEYADGVGWVELASLSDGTRFGEALAQALRITLAAERPALQTVAAVLKDQCVLLMLDNCEHLVDAVADGVELLLREAPLLRVLTTSQEALRISSEAAFRLGSLSSNVSGTSIGGAVELFVARARAANPSLQFDDRMLATAAEICRRLDGMPLAIELAAARVVLLGLDGLRDRLDERFHILTGGARTVLRRHQTLRAALEWSHGLLTADEQVVFRRLGVFAGGFSLDLAQQVASDQTIDRWQVLDLLGHLVDKSLVVAEGASVPRYRLLETARAYALEQLAAAGETANWLRRHAQALLAMLQAEFPSRWTHTAAQRHRSMVELDNVRAALTWALRADRELGVNLLGYAQRVWWNNGLLNEGIEQCLRFLPLPDDQPADQQARFFLALGSLGYLGARGECFDAARRAAELFDRLGESSAQLDALVTVALIGSRRGKRQEVEVAAQKAERLLPADAPPRQAATVPLAQALWHLMHGRHAEAVACADRQAEIYHGNGDDFGYWLARSNRAYYECGLGRYAVAIDLATESLHALRELRASYGIGLALSRLTIAHAMRGDGQSSLAHAAEAMREVRKQGGVLWLLQPIALAHALRGAHERAAQLIGFVDAYCERLGVVARPLELRVRDEVIERVSRALGAERYEEALRTGAALNEEGAIGLALQDVPTMAPGEAHAD